jgi:ribosome-interacting GTPase 1
LGLLKAKLAKYRSQLLEPTGKAGAKGEGFDVMKSGDARVALIGLFYKQMFFLEKSYN